MRNARSLFVSFEGCEGSGKSTQARMLTRTLQAAGYRVVLTREPGGTSQGEAIREMLQHERGGDTISAEAELLLFGASRAQLSRRVIAPALEAGYIVIADRYMDSTTAYQGAGRGLDPELVEAVNRLATGGTVPERTVLIDVDVTLGIRRSLGRQETLFELDRIERESIAFHDRVRRAYLEIARREPERVKVVDGAGPPERVQRTVMDVLADVLPPL